MADIKQIKVGTTTYDIKDGTAREALSKKVSKAGDTMTGNLWISNGLTKGTNPSSDTSRYVSFVDGKGIAVDNRTGAILNQIKTDGTSFTGIYAYDFTADSTQAQVLRTFKPQGGNGYSNVSSADVSNAVLRNIGYGTGSPSGGSAGQVYLQYNADNATNPYVYAEDEIGSSTNSVDKYYSKSEIQNIISNIFTNQSEIIQYKFVSPYNRFKIGDTLFLYGNTMGGNDLSYGITFDSTPIIIAGPPIVKGPGSYANIQVYNIYTNKYSLDTNYGSTTKRNVGVLIIGRYSGNI